jgi:GxxExxY protein
MHPLFGKPSGLTETIIAATIEVHRRIGPGLIESIYEWCLLKELELRGLLCASQKVVVIEYKGFVREEPLRFDVMWRTAFSWKRKQCRACCRFIRHNG